MGKIYYLMGKSSSGKDTIFKKLIEDEELSLKTIVGYTTRPMREGETEGVEYHFVDENRMRELEKQGKVIERRSYDTVHGVWSYFTVDDGQIDLKGDDRYLLIGTLESYEKVRNYFGKEYLVPLYITVDDGVRLQRALDREKSQDKPKYAELCRRFLADEKDFSKENIERCQIDYQIVNEDFGTCILEVRERILAK
ncbi:MAG: guanylate kinase [Lachnospiraceae bacterium]|nr:guanylate kinase [Lachnospiraceae bacterium]